jgi:hypothetical protein
VGGNLEHRLMGRQTGFFTLPEDDRILLESCEQRGIRAIPALIRTGALIGPMAPLAFKRPEGSGMFYLLPAGAPLEAAVYEPTDDPSHSVVMPHKSALLQFVTCRREGDAIADGRIYFDTRRPNRWYENVRRDFESLSRKIKSWPSTDRFRFHVGPTAAEAVRAGQLKLKNAGYELHLA